MTARRRADARLFLVSLAFVTAASFLGLHALATPGVLLDGPNEGFVIATPVGLLFASGFALWSSMRLDGERARWVLARSSWLRLGVIAAVVRVGCVVARRAAPLDGMLPGETATAELWILAVPGVALYAIAAIRYLGLARKRSSPLALAVAAAWALLGEAMLAIALARSWHATWWEWHLLMLAAFAAVGDRGAAHAGVGALRRSLPRRGRRRHPGRDGPVRRPQGLHRRSPRRTTPTSCRRCSTPTSRS